MWTLGRKRYLPLVAANFLWGMLPLRLRSGLRDLGAWVHQRLARLIGRSKGKGQCAG